MRLTFGTETEAFRQEFLEWLDEHPAPTPRTSHRRVEWLSPGLGADLAT